MLDMTTTSGPLRELACRENDGREVKLVWDERRDQLTVTVLDTRTGASLRLDAPRDKALDVFYHPYFYATTEAVRGIDAPLAA